MRAEERTALHCGLCTTSLSCVGSRGANCYLTRPSINVVLSFRQLSLNEWNAIKSISDVEEGAPTLQQT